MADTTLPMDIITTEILPKLPAKSLLRFKCVCKSFKTLISTPEFIHLQLRHSLSSDANRLLILAGNSAGLYTFHLESPEFPAVCLRFPAGVHESYAFGLFVVGSCNGLVCIAAPRSSLVVLNPSTGFFREVHCSYLSAGLNNLCSNYGFGFDDSTDDYKIVRVVAQYSYDDVDGHGMKREVSVYSLKSDSWSLIGRISCQDSLKHVESGAVIDNHLVHWTCWDPSNDQHRIVCFDLRNNRWNQDVPLPDYGENEGGGGKPLLHFADILFETYRNKQNDLVHLGVLDGCLCLLTEKTRSNGVDVWVMKEYDGMKESWVKLVTILNKDISRPLKLCPFAYSKGSKREILISADLQSRFMWYNIGDKTWRWAEMRGVPRCSGACVCKGSLVSIPRGIRFQIGARQNQG